VFPCALSKCKATLDHEEFRKRCGGGTIKVDISWQGTLMEFERKVYAFFQATRL
jgi:hypothetical protein